MLIKASKDSVRVELLDNPRKLPYDYDSFDPLDTDNYDNCDDYDDMYNPYGMEFDYLV